MVSLRQKLSLGFGGLLAIILAISLLGILQITGLGESIDVILRENYRSVVACQQMKEALERMDSGILFGLLGYSEKGSELIRKNELAFEMALEVELHNITLPGEEEKASRLQDLFAKYKIALKGIQGSSAAMTIRRNAYFTDLLPLFQQIKDTAGEILRMNQQNMNDANDLARNHAAAARKQMVILLLAGTMVALAFIFLTGKWILRPINRLIQLADEIKRGNLDLVVKTESQDEVGHLSEAFNAMAASLREFRRSDQAKLIRIQRATQQAFDTLPNAVAVVNLQGKVEVATRAAGNIFGLKPDALIFNLPLGWMIDLYHDVLKDGRAVQGKVVQHFVGGEERFYRPEAIPILDNDRQLTGVTLVLQDVTQLRQQEEMKRGVVSTVSHQLKTPLTSVRMAIHLLLEEKVGPLTEKQVELLVAANEDSDRLYNILNNLLDITGIESGKAPMKLHPVSSQSMVSEAVEPYRRTAQDLGISLSVEVPSDLPEVYADMTRISHAFGNLLSNALKYTLPGGKVTLSAKADEQCVQFSVSDTGRGIPSEYLPRIFEQFFRLPGQGKETGAGLGLSIVKEIVEAHGGTVGVESTVGKGTIFTITLRKAGPIPKEERHGRG